MAINLINILQTSFNEKSYTDVSQYVGINQVSTENGVKAIIPVVLASILGNNTTSSSSKPIWWNALDNDYPLSHDEFVDSTVINDSAFLVKGREVLAGMFRTNHDELVTSVSTVAGIQKEKAAGLIEVSVPLISGYLKNWMKTKGWTFKDLIENLMENKHTITAALPVGMTSEHFGVDNIQKEELPKTIKTEGPILQKRAKKKNNGLYWFGGLLILALILWYFMGSKACTRSLNTDDLLVPETTNAQIGIESYKKVQDGTYYANNTIPKLMLKIE